MTLTAKGDTDAHYYKIWGYNQDIVHFVKAEVQFW